MPGRMRAGCETPRKNFHGFCGKTMLRRYNSQPDTVVEWYRICRDARTGRRPRSPHERSEKYLGRDSHSRPRRGRREAVTSADGGETEACSSHRRSLQADRFYIVELFQLGAAPALSAHAIQI